MRVINMNGKIVQHLTGTTALSIQQSRWYYLK